MSECETNGHQFLKTEPPSCLDCGATISRYDLICSKGNGRVFILGTLNEDEKRRFDKALKRGKLSTLNMIMNEAFSRLEIDTGSGRWQLARPF